MIPKEQLDKISTMSTDSKILEIFNTFPYDHEYLRAIRQSLISDPKFCEEASCSLALSYGAFISLDSAKYGIFSMYLEGGDDRRYIFGYEPEYGVTPFKSAYMDKADAARVYTSVVRFFISSGKDVEDLPLIVNIFPELAKRALADNLTASY